MHEEANSKCDFELKLFLNSQETHSCTKHHKGYLVTIISVRDLSHFENLFLTKASRFSGPPVLASAAPHLCCHGSRD